MNEAITRPTVSIMKACVMASVTRRTIYNWVQKGKVEYIRTAGGSIRIYTDTLFRPGQLAGAAGVTSISNGPSHGHGPADELASAPASLSKAPR